MRSKRQCPICCKKIVGRSDKRFCSSPCKSNYHKRLSASTQDATTEIDKILHRNRSILLEMIGKNLTQIKVPLIELERRKFNFNYMTKYIANKQGKVYHYVYDFSYMTFSTNEVLIIRHKK
jgi:hypothetical protein